MKYFFECFMNYLAFLLKGVNVVLKFVSRMIHRLIRLNQKFIDKYAYDVTEF